jgi:hypothetical protein
MQHAFLEKEVLRKKLELPRPQGGASKSTEEERKRYDL